MDAENLMTSVRTGLLIQESREHESLRNQRSDWKCKHEVKLTQPFASYFAFYKCYSVDCFRRQVVCR